jgi:CubicO group peptidase (beta-lactamase class C family)
MRAFSLAPTRLALLVVGLLIAVPQAHAELVTAQRMREAIAALRRHAEKAMADTRVPGMAIAIVHDGEATFLNYGVRKAGTSDPVDENTVFQLASVSKPITSTILARLVGEGRFGWDDPVSKYDPEFRLHDPYVTAHVTFRDLLSHRSGLPDHAGDLLEDLGYGRRQVLDRLRWFDLDNRWRANYAYTNFGYTAAALAGARASGRGLSWEDLSQEVLYQPLGMTNTSGRFADFVAAKNRAVGHVPADGQWFANGAWAPRFVRDPDAQSPAGGVSSTTRDLTQWVQLTLARGYWKGQKFIDPQGIADAELRAKQAGRSVLDVLDEQGALAETHLPAMLSGYDSATGQSRTYALGWNVGPGKTGHPIWSHSGEFALGARTVVALAPKENFGIVVLVNAAPTGVPEGLQFDFFDLVLLGKVTPPAGFADWLDFTETKFRELTRANQSSDPTDFSRPAPSAAPPSQPLTGYVGTYANEVYGDLKVQLEGDGLVMTLGPRAARFPLTHYRADTFYFTTQGEMQSGPSGAVFERRAGGELSLTLHAYNRDGLGVFERKP